jgi:arylsulfatase A-like enzyme
MAMEQPQPTRRQALAALAAGAAAPAIHAAPARRPPNIVFIMADDLGYAEVGAYGQKKIRTPNIDRLAGEGLKFTDAYAGCTVCAPSRSVLMTGLHGGHTSVRSNPGGVPLLASDVTVASLLREQGYRTAGYGKWGLGDVGTTGVPSRHGFDEFYGYLHQAHAHFYYPKFLYLNERESPLAGNANGGRGTYSNDAMLERALAFVERSRRDPFFLYLPLTIPHAEYLVPADSAAAYRGRFPEDHPFSTANGRLPEQREMRATYAGMVSRLDGYVGRVTELIDRLKLGADTLIAFASDNGGAMPARGDNFFESNGPWRGHKGNFYEGGIRVPFVARWPGRIEAGRVSHLPWAFYDFLPTAVELAGGRAPEHIDGISIVPELLGERAAGRPQQKHPYLYWELPRYEAKSGTFPRELPLAGLRMGEWKAVRTRPGGPLELYNLKSDPGESNNVAATEPQVLSRMEAILKDVRTEPRPQSEPPHPWWGKSGTL